MDYTSCFEDDNDYGEYDNYNDDDDRSSDEESPINSIIYREMEHLFETICEEKYVLFLDQHVQICNMICEAENEDDIFDNMTFNEDNINDWYEEQKHSLVFGNDGHTSEPNLNKYVKLIAYYDDYTKNYHRLVALKDKTKLNNDIIFNIIIKYMA